MGLAAPRALLASLLAASAWAAAPAPMKGTSVVDQLLTYSPPAGWTRSDYANAGGADAVISFENGDENIRLAVYGAPGSFYKTPADFLIGPAATTMGRAPERAGTAMVAGRRSVLYRRGFPLMDTDPHVPSSGAAPRMGTEIFCVLPPLPDGRFLVIAYARGTPVPDPATTGEKSWNSLLKSIRQTSQKTRSSGHAAGSLDSGGSGASPLQ